MTTSLNVVEKARSGRWKDVYMCYLRSTAAEHTNLVTQHDTRGNTLLHIAVQQCNILAVTMLLTGTPLVTGSSLLAPVLEQHHVETCKWPAFWRKSINRQNVNGESALAIAARNGDSGIVKMLMVNGGDYSIQDVYGCGAFQTAILHCKTDIVEYLLSHSDVSTKYSITPSDIVLLLNEGGETRMNLLHELFASVKLHGTDEHKNFMLHRAAASGCIKVAKFLIEKHKTHIRSDDTEEYDLKSVAYVDAKNDSRKTPLMLAVSCGHEEMAKHLLDCGADVKHRDSQGDSVIFHALCHSDIRDSIVIEGITFALMKPPSMVTASDSDAHILQPQLREITKEQLKHMLDILVLRGADVNDISNYREVLSNEEGCPFIHNTKNNLLHLAAAVGNLHAVQIFLDYEKNYIGKSVSEDNIWNFSHDIDEINGDGLTALLLSTIAGHADVVDCLLDHHASPNVCTKGGYNALHFASSLGHVSIVKRLAMNFHNNAAKKTCCIVCRREPRFLVNDINLNVKTDKGETPLIIAVKNNHSDVVKVLLSCQVDVSCRSLFGFNAVETAVLNNACSDIVNDLVMVGEDYNKHQALDEIRVSVTENILDCVRENYRDEQGNTILHKAAQENCVEFLKGLTLCPVDKIATINLDFRNHDFKTPLMIAIEKCHQDVVDMLLQLGADVNIKDAEGNTAFLKILVAAKQPMLQNKNIWQHMFFKNCSSNNHSVMENTNSQSDWQNKQDVEVNHENDNGENALMLASKLGQHTVVKYLLELGAEINRCDENGRNLLHNTAKYNIQYFYWLLKFGLNNNAQDFQGNTLLHVAVIVKVSLETVEYLIVSGNLNTNATNRHGMTALHIAIQLCQWKVAGLLLNLGADAMLPDFAHKAPFDYMFKGKCREALATQLPSIDSTLVPKYLRILGPSSPQPMKQIPGNILENWYRYAITASVHVTTLYDYMPQDRVGSYCECPASEKAYSIFQIFVDVVLANPTMTDKRQRTFLHLLILILQLRGDGPDHSQSQMQTLKEHIKLVANCKDCTGRTALHYLAAADIDVGEMCCSSESFNDIDSIFMELLKYCNINEKDNFGRTPLHYAWMKTVRMEGLVGGARNGMDMLITNFARIDIRDNNEEMPEELSKRFNEYLNESGYLEKYEEMGQVIKSFMIDMLSKSIKNVNNGVLTFTAKLTVDACDSIGTIPDEIWNNFHFAYRHHHSDEISERLKSFMYKLVYYMQLLDSRLEGCLTMVGSSYEKTRIGVSANEFDFNVVLTGLSDVCEAFVTPVCPPGYVHIRRKQNCCGLETKYAEFFDDKENLKTTSIKFIFEKTMKKVLRQKEMWQDETTFNLEIDREADVYSFNPDRNCNTFTLIVNTKLSGEVAFADISVDVVPSLHIKGYLPDETRTEFNSTSEDCHIVFNQPQKIYPWIPVGIPYGRISFGVAESRAIQNSAPALKAAFMIAKHLQKVFDISWSGSKSYYSSHIIKTAALYCSLTQDNAFPKSHCPTTEELNNINMCEVKQWLKRLFDCLMKFHKQGYAPSFFLPTFRLPVWAGEDFLKCYHTILQHYARTNLKSIPQKVLENAKHGFVSVIEHSSPLYRVLEVDLIAHVFCAMFCEKKSEVTLLIVDTTPNPII